MKLLIIESPGKIAKLQGILPSDWTVMACFGHVCDLPEDGMHVGPAPAFVPDYAIADNRRAVVARLRAAAQGADVFLGTDPDREGESISFHLMEILKLGAAKRVRFNEITSKAVLAAVAAPGAINLPLVRAQEARRVWDRLVGYSVSPALRRKTGRPLSAGRVQSPAVRLVVEREREIATFSATTSWGVRLWAHAAGNWWVDLEGDGTDPEGRLTDKSVADRLASLDQLVVQSCEDSEETEGPSPPFTTSTLQQAASVRLGLAPGRTMAIAQQLYEAGHITYHRSDNPNLGEGAFEAIAATEAGRRIGMAAEQRRFKAPASAQAGHPGIAPTHWDSSTIDGDADAVALYRLIWWRAVASQLTAARYKVRKVRLGGIDPVGMRALAFVGSRRELAAAGWRALEPYGLSLDEEGEGESAEAEINPIPALKHGELVDVTRSGVREIKTRAPRRYTEASLIRKLEESGVGRPSTYAAIMETITSRGYVEIEKKFLKPTPLGQELCGALAGHFGFADVGYTKDVELSFDAIAAGDLSYEAAIGKMHAGLEAELAAFEGAAPACPQCGRALMRLAGKSRVTKAAYDLWKCGGDEGCGTAWNDRDGQPDFSAPLVARVARVAAAGDASCPKCGSALDHKKGVGQRTKRPYDFWACSNPKCDGKYSNVDGKPDLQPRETPGCPVCVKGRLRLVPAGVSASTQKPYAAFWSCSNRRCKAGTFQDFNGKPVTAKERA